MNMLGSELINVYGCHCSRLFLQHHVSFVSVSMFLCALKHLLSIKAFSSVHVSSIKEWCERSLQSETKFALTTETEVTSPGVTNAVPVIVFDIEIFAFYQEQISMQELTLQYADHWYHYHHHYHNITLAPHRYFAVSCIIVNILPCNHHSIVTTIFQQHYTNFLQQLTTTAIYHHHNDHLPQSLYHLVYHKYHHYHHHLSKIHYSITTIFRILPPRQP